jgi:hypothetical protein
MSLSASVCHAANKLKLRTNLREVLTATVSTKTMKFINVVEMMMMIIIIIIIIMLIIATVIEVVIRATGTIPESLRKHLNNIPGSTI